MHFVLVNVSVAFFPCMSCEKKDIQGGSCFCFLEEMSVNFAVQFYP